MGQQKLVQPMATLPGSPPSPPDISNHHTRRQAIPEIASIWERHKEARISRVASLERAVVALLEGTLSQEVQRAAQREAHKLAGSLGTFGLPQGSRLAREMEQIFEGQAPLDPAKALPLSDLVVLLRQELERTPAEIGLTPEPEADHDERPLLLVVEQEIELAEALVVEAATRTIRGEIATDLGSARDNLSRQRPDLVLLDLSVTSGVEDGLGLLRDLANEVPPIPVLVLTAQDNLADRVAVARLGGCGFLPRSLPPPRVLEAVDRKSTRLNSSHIQKSRMPSSA